MCNPVACHEQKSQGFPRIWGHIVHNPVVPYAIPNAASCLSISVMDFLYHHDELVFLCQLLPYYASFSRLLTKVGYNFACLKPVSLIRPRMSPAIYFVGQPNIMSARQSISRAAAPNMHSRVVLVLGSLDQRGANGKSWTRRPGTVADQQHTTVTKSEPCGWR